MNLTKNKGMYAESIFSRSCDYYREKHLAIIEKRMLPITIIKKINNQTIIGKLLAKSYVDYCGCYQGKHIEIEVKETNDKNLSLNIVQPHQLKYLKIVEQHHGLGFLLVYFSLYDKFYFVTNHCIQM
jgi:recombination protein U